ncbi:prepilin-type N-terminal cleavage/methylation domain-containing protein [Methylomonas sp. OY6]|uniref:Prepilin-type N-terminal cleavage/methylation domain-containing protein n=1 Tax=Methylomonas defluvii TaxID=3045149 RepID=A0ABU4UDH5_9GAMM|nr:prepilin-type N-terminal cleavage/methylation domain-containing protein [Methylomonas sp. OY6]MDX8127534.1 prepilin-type N-terminal cleavage/methylation domain-containing protein [Methylomonas sp. OY6]
MKGKQLKRLQHRQAGFTLLELLVVITLIATLATAALVAYEGIGDSAQATAASNSTSTADGAIRNYRAVTQKYPDQWDNLVVGSGASAGAAPAFLATVTASKFANWALPASPSTFRAAVVTALESVGITELQQRTQVAATGTIEPNLQHNEGAVGGVGVSEDDWTAISNVAILPTYGDVGGTPTACTLPGGMPTTKLDASTITATDALRQNTINDTLEDDQCNLVIALGFGHDAAHSTSNSSVAISTAPTFVSQAINPATSYARYIALFHVAQDTNEDASFADSEVFNKARLLAVVDTEGRMIDENIAAQNPN